MKITSGHSKLVLVIIFCIALMPLQGLSGNIIDTTDYSYWRKLANTSKMFGAMKTSAMTVANQGDGETRDVMGSNALAYILDPSNKSKYINAIKNKFETRIRTMKIGNGAATSSVPSHELFYAILALDVIRYDLDAAALSKYEGWLEEKIMTLVIGKWDPHAWAMRMLYYKYLGDDAKFKEAKKEFDIGLSEHYMPNDGVSPAGNGYCVQRWNSIERAAKNTTINIMEYMGYNDYYSNPGIVGLKEFMYGYATAPFGRILLYGDSRNTDDQKAWDIEDGHIILSPHIVSAARFSPEAYKYAMWTLREGAGVSEGIVKGHLSNYIIMAGSAKKNNPIDFNTDDAVLAPSRLFENYAALKSREQSTNALYMSMLNLKGNTEYHTHYEANALAMAGYGEILLRNAGYDGPNADATINGVTATFDFMHSNSESANTLMIGGKRHTSKEAEGIVEGLLGEHVEYFRGSSSKAIAGTHFRDVVFMQPSNGVNGYYVVMDHVTTNNAGDNVNVVWHPNASILNTIKNETQYFSEIKIEKGNTGPRVYSENKATLTTFLGTPPASVEIKKTANQSRAGYGYAADYMYANYNTTNQQANILTVLFPGDNNHKTGNLTRIEAGDYTGSEITQGEIVDVAFISNGNSIGEYGLETFQGENILYRKSSDKFISYFVKGTSFKTSKDFQTGFKSDTPVALYMNINKTKGQIVSPGTEVTFYAPSISSVKIEGSNLPIIDSGTNWVSVNIPEGTYEIELMNN
ncbi:hypothetical protein EV196_103320 [Mariniflexile fucanivorans]|uniref:Heparinase II/III-like protein n=1 Tax=Mariniflexile fucanivorans TaxID=264023 RepID=A0A4R1RLY7_9FLAO|nr:hypothetical protein [Mariniflexile fucanivorans]TCL66900.1 hypothetical protein EV196_103320 [Mariniflexile fucanivorans]